MAQRAIALLAMGLVAASCAPAGGDTSGRGGDGRLDPLPPGISFDVTEGDGFTAYSVNADLIFDFNSADVRKDARSTLDQIIASLDRFPGLQRIEVRGHTDALGSEAYNLSLSKNRAQEVADIFSRDDRLVGIEILAIGVGEAEPLEPNELPDGQDNPAGREQNRRVEIIVFG